MISCRDDDRGAAIAAEIGGRTRSVTINLEQWEDEPLVRAAAEVWHTELGGERPDDAGAKVERIACAWQTIQLAWPEGHALLDLLTSRIIPLQAKGVVSFSYRHRPGLSFINCFDRGNLDLIDDHLL